MVCATVTVEVIGTSSAIQGVVAAIAIDKVSRGIAS
jgi:hypothetical protein